MKKQFIEIMKFRPRDFVIAFVFVFAAIEFGGVEADPLAAWVLGGSVISLAFIYFAVRKL